MKFEDTIIVVTIAMLIIILVVWAVYGQVPPHFTDYDSIMEEPLS